MAEFADGGLVTGPPQQFALAPCDVGYVPPSGMCVRGADGGHEWIVPFDKERAERNARILADGLSRGLVSGTITISLDGDSAGNIKPFIPSPLKE